MHNLIRYIRQNRKKIIKILIIIVFLFCLLQLLNYLTKNNITVNSDATTEDIYDRTNGVIKSDKSMVSGTKITKETLDKVNDNIKSFVDKCNEGNVEEAYNMLSSNCKEVLYPKSENFYNNYYKNLFENRKITYSIENWTGDIFIVNYAPDILATGQSLDNSIYKDYITVISENGEKKLNINNYIGRTQINKGNDYENITAQVLYKDVFMDYEIYNMKIKNNTDNNILMDTLTSTKDIYLKDDKKIRHYAYSNELITSDLIIYPRTHQQYKY